MVCETNDYSCGTGDRCLPLSKRCDGHLDCINGQDEDNCHTACDEKEFYCRGQGRCLPARLRCDGVADCTSGNCFLLKCNVYFICLLNYLLQLIKVKMNTNAVVSQVKFNAKSAADASNPHKFATDMLIVRIALTNGTASNCPMVICKSGGNDALFLHPSVDVLTKAFFLLIYRSSDGGWHSVCSSGWTESWSNMACHQMGFNQASGFSNKTEAQPVTQAFMLNSTLFHDEVSLIQSARSNDQEVSCGETVNLECQAQGSQID